MAISPVSMDGALNNMQVEVPGWDFDKVKITGTDKHYGEKELHKIMKSKAVKTIR